MLICVLTSVALNFWCVCVRARACVVVVRVCVSGCECLLCAYVCFSAFLLCVCVGRVGGIVWGRGWASELKQLRTVEF